MPLLALATVTYLGVGLAVLVVGRSTQAWPALAVAHLLTITAVLWLSREASPVPSWLRDWHPLFLMPVLYAEIPILNQGFLSASRDHFVLQLESLVFPFEPARTLAVVAPSSLLSEILHFVYLTFYPIIYGPPLLLYLTGRHQSFRETVFAVMLTYYCCFLMFVLLPVRGPWDLWPASQAHPDGLLRRLSVFILEQGSARGAAFPSSHQAVAAAQTVCASRHMPALAPIIGVLTGGIALGAVYASFHYAIDMIFGTVLGVAVALGARLLYTFETRRASPLIQSARRSARRCGLPSRMTGRMKSDSCCRSPRDR